MAGTTEVRSGCARTPADCDVSSRADRTDQRVPRDVMTCTSQLRLRESYIFRKYLFTQLITSYLGLEKK